MSTTYVAVDVETTGLDPRRDAIIEVAAIVFQENDIIEQFSTFVYPQREIPPEITDITGITNEMVKNAPTIHTVRSKLRPVLSNHIIVGHNIGFDLSFLKQEFLGTRNSALDTVILASILFPEAGRFNLENLVNFLGLPGAGEGQSHRALDDAEQTVELFLALKERALQLPLSTLEEIVQSGRQIQWPETRFFEEMLEIRSQRAFENNELRQRGRLVRLYRPPKLEGKNLVPVDPPEPLDIDLVADMIMPGGNFSHAFPNFEYRQQQVEMLVAVAQSLNEGQQVLIEAGTGTGKSVGYLLPATFWAVQNGRRVVISTNTINLQDQLISKDIPLLQTLLPFELRAAIRKGRGNYLCTRLFQQMRHSGPKDGDEMTVYARMLLWLGETLTGDVGELPLRSPRERIVWKKLNAESSGCTSMMCAEENCPLHIAKRQAELAHVVVVNHSLLLADVANPNSVLPDFLDLIVDEAHHLESAVTSGLSFRADKRTLESILDEITSTRSGVVANLETRARANLPSEVIDQLNDYINKVRVTAQEGSQRLEEFFGALNYFLQEFAGGRNQFASQVRLTTAVRAQPGYDDIEISWDNLNRLFKQIVAGFTQLAGAVTDILESFELGEDGENVRLALQSNGRSLEETRAYLDSIIMQPSDEMIQWVEMYRDRVSLHAAPLHVGPLVEQHIFGAKEAVIMTSATLRTAGNEAFEPNFDYMRQRLHAYDAAEFAVGSPFDYENNTLLYLASDMPEPNQPGYQRYLEQAIIDVAKALGGRTMVLFTSYSQLSQVARAVERPLADLGIATLAQFPGTSRQMILDQFKRPDSRSVLLGTRSFWEGVDVPGDALQAVLLTKIPFDVPSDPIFAARSETFDNSFFQYSIPEAILRFRQGFGRLVRRKSDEGVVAILDKRVMSKRYGQLFVDALPECTVLRQRTSRLGELTLRWLNRDK